MLIGTFITCTRCIKLVEITGFNGALLFGALLFGTLLFGTLFLAQVMHNLTNSSTDFRVIPVKSLSI